MGASQSSTASSVGSPHLSTSMSDHYHRPGVDSHCSHITWPSDNLRVYFGITIGAEVKCFPSSGGVYVHHCSPMELDFLDLPRCDSVPPSSDPAVEDAFCARLQLLGAKWFPSIANKHEHDGEKIFKVRVPPGEDDIHFFGVTSEGGLWVLAIDELGGWEKGVGRIENAANMEDKCKEIEKLGGVFYANPRDCPLLDFRGLDGPLKRDQGPNDEIRHQEL
ncbi:hypothetical protein V8F20_006077 [Naviculisporaceae sp. PSN 640]